MIKILNKILAVILNPYVYILNGLIGFIIGVISNQINNDNWYYPLCWISVFFIALCAFAILMRFAFGWTDGKEYESEEEKIKKHN